MAIDLTDLPKGVKRGPELDKTQADAKEKDAGLELPKELRAVLEQSNGMAVRSGKGKITFLSHSKVVDTWTGFNKTYDGGTDDDKKAEADKGVAQKWWDKGWLPFAKINGADYYCLDQAPAPGGRRGQVILFRKGKPRRQVIAKSLEEFMGMVLDKLK